MDPTTITAIGGFITGIIGIIIAAVTAFGAARKSEMQSLRNTVETLDKENKRLKSDLDELRRENESLREARDGLEKRVSALEAENKKLRDRKAKSQKTEER